MTIERMATAFQSTEDTGACACVCICKLCVTISVVRLSTKLAIIESFIAMESVWGYRLASIKGSGALPLPSYGS